MPRTGRPKTELILSDEEREQLLRWSRRAKSSQALALRSRIVLGCGEGLDNKSVAERVHCSTNTVSKWRARFVQDRLDGLVDEPRAGRPPTITAERVEEVVVATLESTPKNATHWSRAKMADRSDLSKSTIGRIWKAFELKPHREDGFKLSTDPQFVEKVYDVVGLYLNPPEAAVVYCVDEKSQVQALARSQPAFPMMQAAARNAPMTMCATARRACSPRSTPPTAPSSPRSTAGTGPSSSKSSSPRSIPKSPMDWRFIWSAITTAPTSPPASSSGLKRILGSTCTSPRRTRPGSTRSNDSLPTSPPTCSNAATTAASRHSKPTSATGSKDGMRTRSHSSGPSPQNLSLIHISEPTR